MHVQTNHIIYFAVWLWVHYSATCLDYDAFLRVPFIICCSYFQELVSSLTEERDAAKQKVEDLEAKIKSLEKQIVEAKEKETNMPAVVSTKSFDEKKWVRGIAISPNR